MKLKNKIKSTKATRKNNQKSKEHVPKYEENKY